MREGFVSITKVCEFLSLSRATVERLIKHRERNRFPCRKVGAQWRFKLTEIELWVQREATDVPVKARRAICLTNKP